MVDLVKILLKNVDKKANDWYYKTMIAHCADTVYKSLVEQDFKLEFISTDINDCIVVIVDVGVELDLIKMGIAIAENHI